MKLDAIRSIIDGNIQALDQGARLIESLSDAQYLHIASPYVKSSIGQHFRHVVDMFLALTKPENQEVIDYDVRRRGTNIETSRADAVAELKNIKSWMLLRLGELEQSSELDRSIHIRTEVTLEDTHSVLLSSTILRELVFTSSHAVHHYALISVIARLQGVTLEENLGVAPATATFLRQEAAKDQIECAQ